MSTPRYHINGTVCLASEDECAETGQSERWPQQQRGQLAAHRRNGWPAHGGYPCRCAAESFACVCGLKFQSESERDDHVGRNGCLLIKSAS